MLLTLQVYEPYSLNLLVEVRRVGVEVVREAPRAVRVGLVVSEEAHQVPGRSKEVYRKISSSALTPP